MDIDIDLSNRDDLLQIVPHIKASNVLKGELKPHNVGVYFQDIPVDQITGLSAIPYKQAEELGYFKIDLLNITVYRNIESMEELDALTKIEPVWELLQYEPLVSELFHVGNHYAILDKMKPTSIEELAAVIAMIRPAKRYLIGKDWDTVLDEVWVEPENDEYFFKKSHALAYAMVIVVQMNKFLATKVLEDDLPEELENIIAPYRPV